MKRTTRTKTLPVGLLGKESSDSRAGLAYEIRRGADGVVYCSCPSWKFGHTGDCKHLQRWRARQAAAAA